MSSTLRFNDALLITDRAFRPFQCVAWAPQDGTGVVSISVIARPHGDPPRFVQHDP